MCNAWSGHSTPKALSSPRVLRLEDQTDSGNTGATLIRYHQQPTFYYTRQQEEHPGILPKFATPASLPSTSGGIASKAMASPATAEKWWFQNHLALSVEPSTPHVRCVPSASVCWSPSISVKASVKPERTSKISPVWKATPWSLATASSSSVVIRLDEKGEY